jgi:hypothetical protein
MNHREEKRDAPLLHKGANWGSIHSGKSSRLISCYSLCRAEIPLLRASGKFLSMHRPLAWRHLK